MGPARQPRYKVFQQRGFSGYHGMHKTRESAKGFQELDLR